jgi:6-pyruvoyl tetrahydropterin synthase/QueD family protein
MYSVKRIDFCYGHRLLDYDGICKHPHGHNAVAEIEVRTDELDNRNMVCDFSDIKRIVKGWIDRELDHKMVLRPRRSAGRPSQAAGRADVSAREQSNRRTHRAADLRLRERPGSARPCE